MYALPNKNCVDFVDEALDEAGIDTPEGEYTRPKVYMEELRDKQKSKKRKE